MTALNSTANDTPVFVINATNVSFDSFVFVVLEKYNAFSSTYGSLYMGVGRNAGLLYVPLFKGTDVLSFEDGSIQMTQYSTVRVFYCKCDISITRQQ